MTDQVSLPVADPSAPPVAPAGWTNPYVSVSRLRLLEQCRLAFYHRYVARTGRAAGEPDPEPAEFGTVLHAALEATYRWVQDDEYAGPFPTERLLGDYRAAWADSGLAGVELYQEGRAILRRYAEGTRHVDHLGVLGVEREFDLLVTPDGARLVAPEERDRWRGVPEHAVVNGLIDRVDRVDARTVGVVDYKSGRWLYTPDELAWDLQLSIYAMAARALYPWAERVELGMQMLRHGVRQPAERTEDDLRVAREYVLACRDRSERGPYRPRLNPRCDGCDYARGCPAYGDALARKHPSVARGGDLAALAAEHERVSAVAKAAYGRKARIEAVLCDRVRASGGEMQVGGTTYVLEQRQVTEHSARALGPEFERTGIDLTPALCVVDEDLRRVLDRAEADPTTARAAKILRVQVAAKSGKLPQDPKLGIRKKSPR